jgi:phosphoribosylpyrophosphate synthetase
MNAVRQMAHTWKANGVDQVITMHVHNPKIMDIFQEEFGNPDFEALVNVSPVFLYADYLMRFSRLSKDGKLEDGGRDVVFLALDKGSYPMVKELSDIMALPNSRIVRFKKARAVPNDANRLHVELEEPYEEGILEDKDIITLDDIIDTGGTRIKVNQWIEQDYEQKRLGKPRAYHDIFTHAVLAGQSFMDTQRRISQEMPKLREIIMSNTRPYIDDHVDYHRFKTMTTIIRTAKTYGDIIKSGLLNAAAIHERHRDLYKQGMLHKNIYDIKRSSSFDSSIESVPEGFIRQLRVGWQKK